MIAVAPATLVEIAVVVEAVLLVAVLLAIVGHVAFQALVGAPRARKVEAGRAALAQALADPGFEAEAIVAVRRLRAVDRLTLLADFGAVVGGAGRGLLAVVAARVGAIDEAVRRTRARRWTARLRGARVLTALGGGDDAMPRLLDDPRPEVRAQAAAWAASHPTPEVVTRLVEALDDPALVSRFSTEDALVRLGPRAAPALAAALARAHGPSAARLLGVAVAVADSAFAGPAVALLHDAEPETRALAAELAGRVTPGDAITDLVALLEDPDAQVRAAAVRALGAAHHWPAAPRLRAALRDSAWAVRHDAALALRGLGAPGLLLLRRALEDEDRFARDIARRVLELPEPAGRTAAAEA